ncbi:hypothetical protein EYZ11_004903 [Aspergillus tanneri]|nr:hypothetical protein EYZ11_004903 [Aspergillus tanneri]
MAGPMHPWKRSVSEDKIVYFREKFKEFLSSWKQEEPNMWKEDQERFIEDTALGLQTCFIQSMLLIMDREAFETNKPRLLFLDGYRKIIREGRLDLNEQRISEIAVCYERNIEIPEEVVVGEKYKIYGEIGKGLYRLTNEDFADP